jgi:DNA-binding NtrC family response regulator
MLNLNINSDCSQYRPSVLVAQSDFDCLKRIELEAKNQNKFDLVLATSGKTTIENINSHCFDGVVLGLKFPDITGSTLAYLIHEFDPDISIAFLTTYNTGVLSTTAEYLRCKIWDKEKELENIPNLCNKIYELSMENPCKNLQRTLSRKYAQTKRGLYSQYAKLSVPDSLSDIMAMSEKGL